MTDDDEAALTDSELIGISIVMAEKANMAMDDRDVYWRGWSKLQTAVDIAYKRDE